MVIKSGRRRFLALSLVAGILTQALVIVILSMIGFALYESGSWPGREWYFPSAGSDWVYKYPPEPIVLPLNKRATRSIQTGIRYAAMPYSKVVHGDKLKTAPLNAPSFLAIGYTPPQGQQVYQFVEDRIGFPFLAARSVSILESTSKPSPTKGLRWVVRRGIKVTGESGYSSINLLREHVSIPLSPIYSGFLLNTLIYAVPFAALILLLREARLLRARSKARRGLCVSCAYTLAGQSRCPECGMDMNTHWKKAIRAGCKRRALPRLID